MSLFGSIVRSSSAKIGSVYASVIDTCNVVNSIQIRTATKRAAGSKTHMKDSKGRRLGPKKQDGVFVKPGQIIMRQRGTKFYPGENVGIGRDHTIFATEPGWVRYYLDPFHPKRKFIGVALKRELRLPSPHFDPTIRRFGGVLLQGNFAGKEETRMSRREHKSFPDIEAKQQEREAKRQSKFEYFKSELATYLKDLSNVDQDIAAARLVKIDGFLRGGKSISEAQSYATYNLKYDLKLSLAKGEITQQDFEAQVEKYLQTAQAVDLAIAFDSHFRLRKFMTEQELQAKQDEIKLLLEEKYYTPKPVISKQVRDEVYDLIYKSQVFDISTETYLQRKYLKPLDSGKTQEVRRYNYEKRRVETLQRPIFA